MVIKYYFTYNFIKSLLKILTEGVNNRITKFYAKLSDKKDE